MNSERSTLRKYQDDLNVSGTGVIIMGAWSIVRAVIEMFIGTNKMDLDADDPTDMLISLIVTFLVVSILFSIIMMLHLYIGVNAIRASKGMDHKKGYLKATVFFLILSVASLVLYRDDLQDIKNIDTTIAAILVDLTTIYIFIIVIVSSLKIRKIKEKTDRE